MTTSKVAISLPDQILRLAKKQVQGRRAKSLSAFVAQAIDEKLRRDELTELLDAMDAKHGEPSKRAKAWAKRILRPSS